MKAVSFANTLSHTQHVDQDEATAGVVAPSDSSSPTGKQETELVSLDQDKDTTEKKEETTIYQSTWKSLGCGAVTFLRAFFLCFPHDQDYLRCPQGSNRCTGAQVTSARWGKDSPASVAAHHDNL